MKKHIPNSLNSSLKIILQVCLKLKVCQLWKSRRLRPWDQWISEKKIMICSKTFLWKKTDSPLKIETSRITVDTQKKLQILWHMKESADSIKSFRKPQILPWTCISRLPSSQEFQCIFKLISHQNKMRKGLPHFRYSCSRSNLPLLLSEWSPWVWKGPNKNEEGITFPSVTWGEVDHHRYWTRLQFYTIGSTQIPSLEQTSDPLQWRPQEAWPLARLREERAVHASALLYAALCGFIGCQRPEWAPEFWKISFCSLSTLLCLDENSTPKHKFMI